MIGYLIEKLEFQVFLTDHHKLFLKKSFNKKCISFANAFTLLTKVLSKLYSYDLIIS